MAVEAASAIDIVDTGARRLLENVTSILSSDVTNRVTTFALYALIARHLGMREFGQLSLALTLFSTFQVLATAGLRTLMTREVARDRTKTGYYLVNGSLVVGVASVVSIAALVLFAQAIGYDRDTAAVILLVALGLLPSSLLAVCDAIFQAWERMRYIAYIGIPTNLVKLGLAFAVLSLNRGLYEVGLVLLASHVGALAIGLALIVFRIVRPSFRVDLAFSARIARMAGTFLGLEGIAAIMGSFTFVFLSKVAGETEVGLYNAAAQLMAPVVLIYQSIATSVFPIMCRRFAGADEGLKHIAEDLVQMLLAITLPIAVVLFFRGDSMFLLLYGGKEFMAAFTVLRVTVWILALRAFTAVLGRVLVAALSEKTQLRISIVNALVTLALGSVLITRFGLIGAAVTALSTAAVNAVQHYIPVSRMIPDLALARSVARPLFATACMALYLAGAAGQGFLVALASAAAVYLGVWLILEVWASGGPRRLRTKYVRLWSEGPF